MRLSVEDKQVWRMLVGGSRELCVIGTWRIDCKWSVVVVVILYGRPAAIVLLLLYANKCEPM